MRNCLENYSRSCLSITIILVVKPFKATQCRIDTRKSLTYNAPNTNKAYYLGWQNKKLPERPYFHSFVVVIVGPWKEQSIQTWSLFIIMTILEIIRIASGMRMPSAFWPTKSLIYNASRFIFERPIWRLSSVMTV